MYIADKVGGSDDVIEGERAIKYGPRDMTRSASKRFEDEVNAGVNGAKIRCSVKESETVRCKCASSQL